MIFSLRLFVLYGVLSLKLLTVSSESNICGFENDMTVCCDGYKKDDDRECTIPICTGNCGAGGQCMRPDTCQCANGKVASSCFEEELNNNRPGQNNVVQCPHNCNDLGTCVNGKCQCKYGYTGESCSEEMRAECYLDITRGICVKHKNSIKLSLDMCCGAFDVAWGDPCKRCERGRCEKGLMEIDGICQDIDECKIPDVCQHGYCINRHGSYWCQCSSTYRFDPTLADCVQMKKKCQQTPNLCGPGMECVSLSVHNHICRCLPGYIKRSGGNSCIQKNKIQFNYCNAYGRFVCNNGKCVPDGRNYKCECNPGFIASSDGKSCKKSMDLCSIYGAMICRNGKCVSLINDYSCQCDPGYSPSYNRKSCTSICDMYPNRCPNGKCVPLSSHDYECRCYNGYAIIGKEKQCRRIMNDQSVINSATSNDESSSLSKFDTDYCAYKFYRNQCQGGRCMNMKNNYYCECLPGFTKGKNGQACFKQEVSRQSQMNDAASSAVARSYCEKYGSVLCSKGRCVESGSSYQCKCNSGYQESSDGKKCYDINECTNNPSICQQGTCINSPGSYQCSCKDGFTIHYIHGGPKCYDRDECSEDKKLCENGACVNTWGSYRCSCDSGYVLSNREQNCVPAERPTGQETNSKICKSCSEPCRLANATHWICPCPRGLSPILNVGLCVPMDEVVDVQFEIPNNVITRMRRDTLRLDHVYLELVSNANTENFRLRITTQFKNVVLDKCLESNKEGERAKVVCYYHKSSQN